MSVAPAPTCPLISDGDDEHQSVIQADRSRSADDIGIEISALREDATIPFADSTVVAKEDDTNDNRHDRITRTGSKRGTSGKSGAQCSSDLAEGLGLNAVAVETAADTIILPMAQITETQASRVSCDCERMCQQMVSDMKKDFSKKLNQILSHLRVIRTATGCSIKADDKELGVIGATTPAGANCPVESNFSTALSRISVPDWAAASEGAGTSGMPASAGLASPELASSRVSRCQVNTDSTSEAVPGRRSGSVFQFKGCDQTGTSQTFVNAPQTRQTPVTGSQKKRKKVISDSDKCDVGDAKKVKYNLYPETEIHSKDQDMQLQDGESSNVVQAASAVSSRPTHRFALSTEARATGLEGIEEMDRPTSDVHRDRVMEATGDKLDQIVLRDKNGRQKFVRRTSSEGPVLESQHNNSGQVSKSVSSSTKKSLGSAKRGGSVATVSSGLAAGREWARTKEQHEKRRASDLRARFSYVNKRAQTLVIGDSHLHGIRGFEVSPSVHFMVAGGLCFTATARCLSEIRETFQHFRMIYVALGTNDVLHHSDEEIRAGLAFLLEQLKRVFPNAKVEFIMPFVSPKLRSLGFEIAEFQKLLRSVLGTQVIHHNIDLSHHLDYFADNPKKPGPPVHLKREYGIGLMVNLIKGVMGIQQPIAKNKLFNRPAPTPSKSYWAKTSVENQATTRVDTVEDFPPLAPSKLSLDKLTIGQFLKAIELASSY